MPGEVAPLKCIYKMFVNDGWVGYEWDEAKRVGNIRKHGIDFVSVLEMDWEFAVIQADLRRNYGEERFRAFVPIRLRLHVVIYARRAESKPGLAAHGVAKRGDVMRVISLRKANEKERREWMASLPG